MTSISSLWKLFKNKVTGRQTHDNDTWQLLFIMESPNRVYFLVRLVIFEKKTFNLESCKENLRNLNKKISDKVSS